MLAAREIDKVRDTDKLLYTVQQVSALLEISYTEIYREMARGRIQGIRIGRSRRFSRAELERYVLAKYAETQSA